MARDVTWPDGGNSPFRGEKGTTFEGGFRVTSALARTSCQHFWPPLQCVPMPETNRQNHERRAQSETSRRALEKIERSIKGIMDAIEDGMYQPAMKARIEELVQQKAEIDARLAEAPADLPDRISLSIIAPR